MILHILWLPSRRSLAETAVAAQGHTARHASGCCRADGLVSRACESHREIGRSGVVRAQIWRFALPPATLNPRALPRKYFWLWSSKDKNAFSPSQYSRSPDLPVKSRSREVARLRHGSFCNWGCILAARCVESLAAASLAEATGASSVSPHGTPRAASVLTAGGEALRDFSQEGQKIASPLAGELRQPQPTLADQITIK
jgi:hypothetical protein